MGISLIWIVIESPFFFEVTKKELQLKVLDHRSRTRYALVFPSLLKEEQTVLASWTCSQFQLAVPALNSGSFPSRFRQDVFRTTSVVLSSSSRSPSASDYLNFCLSCHLLNCFPPYLQSKFLDSPIDYFHQNSLNFLERLGMHFIRRHMRSAAEENYTPSFFFAYPLSSPFPSCVLHPSLNRTMLQTFCTKQNLPRKMHPGILY